MVDTWMNNYLVFDVGLVIILGYVAIMNFVFVVELV